MKTARSLPYVAAEALLLTIVLYMLYYFFVPPPPPSQAVVSLFALLALCFAFGRRAMTSRHRTEVGKKQPRKSDGHAGAPK